MTAEHNYFNYFTEIEDVFVRLRGKHVFISPLDWVLIEQWKTKGIPLYVALRGIETAFASHGAKQQKRAVKTLLYCQEEVEAQYAEWMESQVGATAAEGDEAPAEVKTTGLPFPREAIVEHLDQGLNALREFSANGAGDSPALAESLHRVVTRLEAIAGDFARAATPDAEALEDSLTELERVLHDALLTQLPAAEIAEATKAAVEQLKPYKARMEKATYEQTRDGLVLKQLLNQKNLPRLSLFYI